MNKEEKELLLTLTSAVHISILTLGKVLQRANATEELKYEMFQLNDLAESIRTARDKVFKDAEINEKAAEQCHGRFVKHAGF